MTEYFDPKTGRRYILPHTPTMQSVLKATLDQQIKDDKSFRFDKPHDRN